MIVHTAIITYTYMNTNKNGPMTEWTKRIEQLTIMPWLGIKHFAIMKNNRHDYTHQLSNTQDWETMNVVTKKILSHHKITEPLNNSKFLYTVEDMFRNQWSINLSWDLSEDHKNKRSICNGTKWTQLLNDSWLEKPS